MTTSFQELRTLLRGFDGRVAAVEAKLADEAEPIAPEERRHTAAFCKWLRAPQDYGLKSELAEIEGDLSHRAVDRAKQRFLFAEEQAAAARHALEVEPVTTRTKIALLSAERDTLRAKIALEDTERSMQGEHKDVSVGTGATGGFAVPKEIGQRIARRTVMLNPFRRLCRVDRAGSSDYKPLLDLNNGGGGWIGETGTRISTTTPQLREIEPTYGELYALATTSEWGLDDLFFDVESWLVNAASDQFAALEAAAIVSGDGVSKISGFLSTAPAAIADGASPPRAADQLEFLAGTGSPISPVASDFTTMLALFGDGYLETSEGAGWVVSRSALGHIRGLDFLNRAFIESAGPGQPAMLYGLPLFVTAAMPATGSSSFPIAVGDWSRGYVLVDRVGLRITFDEVSTPGLPRFYIRRRVSGEIADSNALKLMQF